MSLANCEGCEDENVWVEVLVEPMHYKTRAVEKCIVPLVKMLNDYGIPTSASCCGHKHGLGSVSITAHRVSVSFPPDGTVMFTLHTMKQGAPEKNNAAAVKVG